MSLSLGLGFLSYITILPRNTTQVNPPIYPSSILEPLFLEHLYHTFLVVSSIQSRCPYF